MNGVEHSNVEPVCRHFGACGGCAMQDLPVERQLQLKTAAVRKELVRNGLNTTILPGLQTTPHSRRRAAFSAERQDGGIRLGYLGKRSHDLIGISECPVMAPAIVDSLDDYIRLAAVAAPGKGRVKIKVTDCENGLDVNLSNTRKMDEPMRRQMSSAARNLTPLRVSVDDEIILQREEPFLLFGAVRVVPPPGAFLQPVAELENAMAGTVLAHLEGCKSSIDLFSGSGAFTFRLATAMAVHAVEVDAAAVDALATAAAHSRLKPVTSELRDLFERPVTAGELKRFDSVVLDPPRAGAQAQCREIAKAGVAKVAYVSCNPETLMRDAALLVEKGYRFDSVMPVDQFLFSPHIEAVALFSRSMRRERPLFG